MYIYIYIFIFIYIYIYIYIHGALATRRMEHDGCPEGITCISKRRFSSRGYINIYLISANTKMLSQRCENVGRLLYQRC